MRLTGSNPTDSTFVRTFSPARKVGLLKRATQNENSQNEKLNGCD